MPAKRSRLRFRTNRGSPAKGSPLGLRMSQNIRATAFCRGRQGRSVKVVGSGKARISLSFIRAKPSTEAPSNPTPCSIASCRSSTVIAKPFRLPRMSVNQSRMNFTSFSWALRNTKSRWAARSSIMVCLPDVPLDISWISPLYYFPRPEKTT